MLDEYNSLARGVTYAAPKIPVVSTVTASVVDAEGIFNRLYLGRHTRQPVDFLGALKVAGEIFGDPVWFEIGPRAICSSFVRSSLSPSPGKILATLEPGTNPWVSISNCLAGVYTNGIAVDWLAFHAPFVGGLNLLTPPSYAWDLKDYWITYTEADQKQKAIASVHQPVALISTCAQYLVQESSSPKLLVTLGASMADPAFNSLINGHRIRGVSIVPGSVFCDAGLAAAKYATQYGRMNVPQNSIFTIRDVSLRRPLTRALVGADGELLTTAVTDNSSGNTIHVS